jgi:hypothetical protein
MLCALFAAALELSAIAVESTLAAGFGLHAAVTITESRRNDRRILPPKMVA